MRPPGQREPRRHRAGGGGGGGRVYRGCCRGAEAGGSSSLTVLQCVRCVSLTVSGRNSRGRLVRPCLVRIRRPCRAAHCKQATSVRQPASSNTVRADADRQAEGPTLVTAARCAMEVEFDSLDWLEDEGDAEQTSASAVRVDPHVPLLRRPRGCGAPAPVTDVPSALPSPCAHCRRPRSLARGGTTSCCSSTLGKTCSSRARMER